ncbi:MAG: T9SS type A sorting domain-containing protein [Flavobacteriales bacterium]|nr:T9SS type A sorting domain-containing protein [Flavobacteriales bacterium]
MIARYIHTLAMAALSIAAMAQIATDGMPYSLRAGLDDREVANVEAAPFDAVAAAADDAQRQLDGMLPAYARVLPLEAGLFDAGTWSDLPNGDRLWRLRVESKGALATELYFSEFHLPANATLHVYSPDGKQVMGGFTAYNNRDDGTFATGLLAGEASMVEYYEPAAVAGLGRVHISGVGHAYRDVDEVTASGSCEVDVNCSEGGGWEGQRDAVVRISILDQGLSYWCSGSLVNNVAQDCKPYFLTAMHCGETTSSSDFNQWKFYFNYERTGCGTGASFANHFVVGCTKRGSSNDGGGNQGSDFLLLEANTDSIPDSFNPYWAGWDASGTGGTGGKCIHHPDGDRKKISTYNGSLVSSTWGGVPGTHWRVVWSATANGHGVTEGGSSGSPIFNGAKRIVGTLTGGLSCCTTNGCGPGTSISAADYYGKMSYHWASNPGSASMRLKNFLDPQSTGTLVLEGSYDPCGMYVGVSGPAARQMHVEVRPNPADGEVFLRLPTPMADAVIEVHDMGGRAVAFSAVPDQGGYRLNTGAFDNGAYALRLLVGGSVVATTPLIVVHP